MRRDPAAEVEIETYLECTLCCGIIDKGDKSFYFWDSEKLVNVCRNCAGKLLKGGWRILGTTKPQRMERYDRKTELYYGSSRRTEANNWRFYRKGL